MKRTAGTYTVRWTDGTCSHGLHTLAQATRFGFEQDPTSEVLYVHRSPAGELETYLEGSCEVLWLELELER